MVGDPRRIGRYQLEDRLGRGGMGSCYRARDLTLNRWVALKLLHGELDSAESRQRFAREARAAAALNHPNIVTVHDFGEQDGNPFIVMEYVQGDTLAALIRTGTLTVVAALRVLEELCAGLAYAHRSGVIHRDIKPLNLMVDHQGGVKILDFGIARLAGSVATTTGLMGTPGYMSPEQIKGETLDHRCDLFAAGAVAYELLSRRVAFAGETFATVINAVLEFMPPPLADQLPLVGAMLDPIVFRALSKAVADRYPDAESFSAEIESARRRLEDVGDTTPIGGTAGQSREAAEPKSGGSGRALAAGTPADPDGVRAMSPTPGRRGADREAAARRRAVQIQLALDRARQALIAGNYEEALARCEDAATFDENHPDTIQMLDRVRQAMDRRDARSMLVEGRAALDRDDVDGAAELAARARALHGGVTGLQPLVDDIERRRAEVERQRAEQERVRRQQAERDQLVRSARAALAAGDAAAALELAARAVELDPGSDAAWEVQRAATARVEQERRAAVEEQDARAAEREAQRLFATGWHEEAFEHLRGAAPHPIVVGALAALMEEHRELTLRREETVVATARRPQPDDGTDQTIIASVPTAVVGAEGDETRALLDRPWFSGSFVNESADAHRRSLLSASLFGHAAIIGAIVLIALAAGDVLPAPPDRIVFLAAELPPPPPPPIEVPRPKPSQPEKPTTQPQETPLVTTVTPEPPPAAPVEAPPEVKPEPAPAPRVEPPPVTVVETPPVPAPPAPPAVDIGSPDRPIADVDVQPTVLREGRVSYPALALQERLAGVVEVAVTIDPAGKVVNARIVRSLRALDLAAIETANGYTFRPARKRGRAVYSQVILEITFTLPKS